MALAPGTRLGPYEIDSALGAGGMGEVYRATDTNLKRQVAIKVLPDAVATDSERLARFQREAEVLASLNHPNIAAIYGLEKSDGTAAIVMELVEGPTLADRIAQGPIPLDEALPLAKQIAEGLEAAHEQAVIHRDLKPANIKLRSDGTVKILDFGLAKALEGAGDTASGNGRELTHSPTITSPMMTRVGVILGTAAYMSPEQARGKSVDRRADMFAFGAVLYEMLAGRPAFSGEDAGEILAAVVKSDVDWSRLPADTPAGVRTLLRRCLRKDPRQRLADSGAARLELEEALAMPTATARTAFWRRTIPFSYALIAVAVAATGTLLIARSLRTLPSTEPSHRPARLAMLLPPGTELVEGAFPVAISPDGTQVAYGARTRGGLPQLYLRPLSGGESRAMARINEREVSPFFSPDGQWLAFFADGKLKKVSTTSGVVQTVTDTNARNGTWGPGNRIVFNSTTTGLMEISGDGGSPRELTTQQLRNAVGFREPEFLPGGGDALLVAATPRGADTASESSIEVFVPETGERKVLVQGGTVPHYLPSGHLIFQRSGAVMAVKFDLRTRELSGTPTQVLDGIRHNFGGWGAFSCSRDGNCVYLPGGSPTARTVSLVDRTGASRSLPLPPKSYGHPRFSRNGDKLSLWIQQIRCDIEIYDLARGSTTRLTSDGDNHVPVWSPDGLRVTYTSRKPGADTRLFWKAGNSNGPEEPLTAASGNLGSVSPLAWVPDGTALVVANAGDLWLFPRLGNPEPRPLIQSKFTETAPAVSPDGHWIAYVSDESGQFQVYVQAFPGLGEKYPISTDGGTEPVWARKGGELFFRSGGDMMVSEIAAGSVFNASRPRVLFRAPFMSNLTYAEYDVSADGKQFVVLNSGEREGSTGQIGVLLDWFEELKRRVPTK